MAVLSETLLGSSSVVVVGVVAALLVFGLVMGIFAILLRMRQRKLEQTLVDRMDVFLPPFVGGTVPKEETYVVPRDWKPTSALGGNRVYSPLSIPIEEPRTRHSSSKFQSFSKVLPPTSSSGIY